MARAALNQVVEVEWQRAHPIDATLPDLARPVGVDLDSVVIRIAQVERLADEVVRGSRQSNAVTAGVRQPAPEVRRGLGTSSAK